MWLFGGCCLAHDQQAFASWLDLAWALAAGRCVTPRSVDVILGKSPLLHTEETKHSITTQAGGSASICRTKQTSRR